MHQNHMILLKTRISNSLVWGLGTCVLTHSSGNAYAHMCENLRITEPGDVVSEIYCDLLDTLH